MLFTEKQANRELVQEFQLDKEDLENEYTRFAQQYDELKMTISNDSLAQLLDQEQLKTQRLLEELRTVKSTNATEIRRLKKELATLRKVMIGYINQIDSLNKLTEQQKLVIADVTKKYNQASQQISNLSEEKKNLNKKVTLAAQLDATNIRIEPRNKRGKVAKKVKDVASSASPLCVIAGEGAKSVSFSVTEAVLDQVHVGEQIKIEKNGSDYVGTVTEVNTMVDAATGLFKVKATVEDNGSLISGSSVKLYITSDKAENVMTIPVDAVYYSNGEPYVYTYDNGTVHKVTVETGISDDEKMQILSGLSADNEVITTWDPELYEGAPAVLAGETGTTVETVETVETAETAETVETTETTETTEVQTTAAN